MARITLRQLLDHAAENDYGLPAYNINNMEQALGLFEGHLRARAPFIVQLSKGARAYAGSRMLEAIIRAAEERYPEAVFAVHLDHGDEATCYDAIDSGFYSSVMIDASHDPFEENVAATRRVVERAHAAGISVEAELGMLGGVEEDIAVDEKNAKLTDPDEAKAFVEQSGCDSLAVAIGTSHGAYKFSGGQGIHFDRVAEIQKRLPGFPLVMHGSSSVPQDEVERINAAGGTLDPTARGVDVEHFARAIPLGVTKVNIDMIMNGYNMFIKEQRVDRQNLQVLFEITLNNLRADTGDVDEKDFIAVGPTLQSLDDPNVFAAGDCASMVETPREKAGVYAVRAGPPLARNLIAMAQGQEPEPWRPQKRHLALITTGEKYAVASRGAFKAEGAWLWHLKDWIDRRWMDRYRKPRP